MRRLFAAILVVSSTFLLGACSTAPERVEGGGKRAADLNAQLGVAYMSQGNNEWALEKLQKALRQDPGNVQAHHYIAELYRRLGELDKADRHFREALRRAPDQMALQNNYGVFLCERDRFREAEQYFLKVLGNPLNDSPHEVYENLGLCALRQGDVAGAERYLRSALKFNPQMPKALLGMAQVSVHTQQYAQGRDFLQRFSALAPHNPASLWTGIQIEQQLGNRNAVASYTLLLRGKFPDSAEAKQAQQQQGGQSR